MKNKQEVECADEGNLQKALQDVESCESVPELLATLDRVLHRHLGEETVKSEG